MYPAISCLILYDVFHHLQINHYLHFLLLCHGKGMVVFIYVFVTTRVLYGAIRTWKWYEFDIKGAWTRYELANNRHLINFRFHRLTNIKLIQLFIDFACLISFISVHCIYSNVYNTSSSLHNLFFILLNSTISLYAPV